ncbi:MAG TPA: GNAT family N-acetyltransferase [Pirellulales bacterium]|nr:GNAT family N-acetyltransferase [Pirellulales bacterium]
MIKIELLRAHELSDSLKSDWARIQEAHAEFDSPYFRVEFTDAVAAVRDDVWIAVLEQAGQPVGFFPFHRDRSGVGWPVGAGMSDFHGVIAHPDLLWRPNQLIRDCGLKEWKFHALVVSDERFASFADSTGGSPFIDVSQGFEAYANEQRRRGSRVVDRLKALARKLHREVGPLRYEAHCADAARLHQLLDWKWRRYGSKEPTRDSWPQWRIGLLERIQRAAAPAFAGMCSLLWAGDKLVAAHMGMRAGRVFHYWFPSYDEAYARYSPGLLLLVDILKDAHRLGVERADLGQGGEDYKGRFMTGSIGLLTGSIVVSPRRRALRRFKRQSLSLLRKTPLRPLWRSVRTLFS